MADMTDIHDIRLPVRVGMDPGLIRILAGVLILALLAGLGLWLYRYLKRRRARGGAPLRMLPMPRPPEEIALEELAAARDLMERDPRLYCFRLTRILKGYLGRRYRFNAPEMTTQEIAARLRGLDMEMSRASDLKEFMTGADNVKYSGRIPGRETLTSGEEYVRSFVLADCPKPSPPVGTEGS